MNALVIFIQLIAVEEKGGKERWQGESDWAGDERAKVDRLAWYVLER